MGKKKNGQDKPPGISAEDMALWNAVNKGTKVMPDRKDRRMPAEEAKAPPPIPKPQPKQKPETSVRPKAEPVNRGKGIDGGIARKLSRGDMKPQGFIDLHGKTQEQAHKMIVDFITASHAQGYRLVRIITGTGARTRRDREPQDWTESEPGVLKRRFAEFMADPRIRDIVLDFREAHRKHGGAGAYYVYLRSKDKMTSRPQ